MELFYEKFVNWKISNLVPRASSLSDIKKARNHGNEVDTIDKLTAV